MHSADFIISHNLIIASHVVNVILVSGNIFVQTCIMYYVNHSSRQTLVAIALSREILFVVSLIYVVVVVVAH